MPDSVYESEPLIKAESGMINAVIEPLEIEKGPKPNQKNQLGTINGVYIPCLLNILGAVLFMRVGYVVGYAGWYGAVLLFLFSNVVAVLTAFSFSAIVTNGKMGGGGVYYMISRSMGPEFGGATGILFYICYVINSAFNATAMVEDVIQSYLNHSPDYVFNIMYHGTLFFLLLVALAGADAFAKLNLVLFFALISAMLVCVGSIVFSKSHHIADVSFEDCYNLDPTLPNIQNTTDIIMHGPKWSRWMDNMDPDWSSKNDMVVVLALVYTTTCGIMVGANLSGDLKDPGASLPKGTLGAMFTSFMTYLIFATILASSFDRRSLQCDYLVLQRASVSSIFVVGGVAMATLSTSLGAMFGAARILQAIARDNILPISFFAKGTKKGDEPIRAVVLTWLLVNAFGYIGGGSVQSIAQILTDFFLTACAFVNLSQMLLSLSNAPNYRPSFKYATWWSSGLGFILALTLMWYLNVVHAAITCGFWTVIFIYIQFTVDEKPWGDVVQAIMFRQIIRRLRRVVQRKDHAKFWRSAILLLAVDGDHPLFSLCKFFTKDSLFVVGIAKIDEKEEEEEQEDATGYVIPKTRPIYTTSKMLPNQRGELAITKAAWMWFVEQVKAKAFVTIGIGTDLIQIYRQLIACTGLGALVPNTVLIPYEERATSEIPDFIGRVNDKLRIIESCGMKPDKGGITRCCKLGQGCGVCNDNSAHNSGVGLPDPVEYVSLLQHVLDLEKNCMIVRNSAALDSTFDTLRKKQPLEPVTIDLWIVGSWSYETMQQDIALLLQHAHLMQEAFGKMSNMRIIQLVEYEVEPSEKGDLQMGLKELVTAARIPMPEILVIQSPNPNPEERMPMQLASADKTYTYYHGINDLIREQMTDCNTKISFLAMPPLPDRITEESANVYIGCLNALTTGLGTVVLISKGERQDVISFEV